MRILSSSTLLGLTMLFVGVACSDATGPRNPLAGTWEVTTVLDAYKVEEPCTTYEYCYASYSANGATLSGRIVIDPTVTDTIPLGIFTGAFCDTFDFSNGCTHIGSPTLTRLDQGYVRRGDTYDTRDQLEIFVRGPDDPARLPYYHSYEHIYFQNVKVDGDSAYGTLWWARTIARQPPGYTGTFVAHRQ